ncbi:MAG: putative glycoside hydrolase, partial [Anaerolineales bacterium]
AHKAEASRDQLRSLGVTAPIPGYLLLTEIHNPGDCTIVPRGNQVAFHPGDFCMIASEHPDWFLLDTQGKPIGGGSVYFMDPGNPGFRAFWLERARELQENYGWEGVFIDNAFASLGQFRSLGTLPQKYSSDQAYREAVLGFLKYLRESYFQPQGRRMFANVASTQDYAGVWREFLDPLDGLMVENFAAGWLGRTKSRAEWEEQMEALEEAHRRGKTTILVAQGEQDDLNRQKFSFASYLLIANDYGFFRYAKSGVYSQMWLYDNYRVDLGQPLSTRYRQGDAWRRDFVKGSVIVNPGTLQAELVLQPVPVPTFSDPYVSTVISPASLDLGGTALVNVELNNVPAEGYKSAEFTCTYDASLVEVSNIVAANLFGADAVMAIHGPQNGTFIAAIAGTNGNKAVTSGPVYTFSVKGLQTGQSPIQCTARVSKGDNMPINLPSTAASLTIPGAERSPDHLGPLSDSSQPTTTGIPLESQTPTLTPLLSLDGVVTGQVIASKPVTASLLDANNVTVASVMTNPDGIFNFTAPVGNYTVVAVSSGFLSAQGPAPITAGSTTTKPMISLLAGDIDGNNVIDQFDALTIGMSYSTATPSAANLNNDGVIDFLDLELLAGNYRVNGLTAWE